jgi:hypothetical protein
MKTDPTVLMRMRRYRARKALIRAINTALEANVDVDAICRTLLARDWPPKTVYEKRRAAAARAEIANARNADPRYAAPAHP